MRTASPAARPLSLIALAVAALHVLLIGGVAEQLVAGAAPRAGADVSVRRVPVLAVEPIRAGAQGAVQRATPQPLAAAQALPAPARDTQAADARTTERVARPARRAQAPAPAAAAKTSFVDSAPRAAKHGAEAAQAPAAEPAVPAVEPGAGFAPPAAAAPVYPTDVPAAFAFAYTLTRGSTVAHAELRWQIEGDRYGATLTARDGDRALLAWRSSGGFDAAGIAPERFVDRRRGRGALAANFRRDEGTVSFSGPRIEQPLAPGMQDRLSWMLQLAAIAAADPARAAAEGVAMIVVGVRGDADVWRFEPVGSETLDLPGASLPALRLLRLPARAYDTRAEVWLAPSQHYLPLRVRLSNGTAAMELQWRGTAP